MNPVTTLATCLLLASATASAASEIEGKLTAMLEGDLAAWAQDQIVLDAIQAQNQRHAQISQAEIDALDAQWRAEIDAADRPTITPILENAASDALRARIAASGGLVTEAFVMDAHGLNAATAGLTSDYWQGDEAKFTETFPHGADGVHIGEVEFDESTQTFQVQLSFTLQDPSGTPVGAMTIAVNADAL